MLHDDTYSVLTHIALLQAEPHAQVDRGHDSATQVQRTDYRGRRKRDRVDLLRRRLVSHLGDWNAAQLPPDRECEELTDVFSWWSSGTSRRGQGLGMSFKTGNIVAIEVYYSPQQAHFRGSLEG